MIEQNIRDLTYKVKAVNAVVFHSKRRLLMLGALNLSKGLTEKMDSFRSHELWIFWLDDGRESSKMTEQEGDWSEWSVSKKQQQAASRPPGCTQMADHRTA